MSYDTFNKKPAFFPFVSAEVFFEAEANPPKIETDEALDSELEKLLGANTEESVSEFSA